jgi:hypothetical protein
MLTHLGPGRLEIDRNDLLDDATGSSVRPSREPLERTYAIRHRAPNAAGAVGLEADPRVGAVAVYRIHQSDRRETRQIRPQGIIDATARVTRKEIGQWKVMRDESRSRLSIASSAPLFPQVLHRGIRGP